MSDPFVDGVDVAFVGSGMAIGVLGWIDGTLVLGTLVALELADEDAGCGVTVGLASGVDVTEEVGAPDVDDVGVGTEDVAAEPPGASLVEQPQTPPNKPSARTDERTLLRCFLGRISRRPGQNGEAGCVKSVGIVMVVSGGLPPLLGSLTRVHHRLLQDDLRPLQSTLRCGRREPPAPRGKWQGSSNKRMTRSPRRRH